MEHNLWIEAQLKAFEFSSTVQEGVKAFVDVKLEKASVLHWLLHELGANVNLRCFMEQIRVDEAPYLLYGLSNLAVPMRLMAMGRIGKVNKSFHDEIINRNDNSMNHSQIVYAIEMLSDQLASKLSSFSNEGNIDAVEVISPIVDRVRKRLDELSFSKRNSSLETPSRKPASNLQNDISPLSLSNEKGESIEVCSMKIAKQHISQTKGNSRINRRHTISRISSSHGESVEQFITPTEKSASVRTVNLVEITQSEPMKRRGRPLLKSEQLIEYTPTRFHRYLRRRCRFAKAERAVQLNTEKMVGLYRTMIDRNLSEILSNDQKSSTKKKISKIRPVVVRTRSSVLNELQNIPSSNEFVKKRTSKKRVKTGNIVLSGISKIGRETVYAIARKLGVLKIANTVDERTRYVVSDEEGVRTVNVMRALVKGIPVVTIEWAYRSLEAGGWLKGGDFLVPQWKTAHKGWVRGSMAQLFSSLGLFYVSSKCEPETKHILHFIKCCRGRTTESLNRAVIFVGPLAEWATFMQLRKNTDAQVTCITEKSLLAGPTTRCGSDGRIVRQLPLVQIALPSVLGRVIVTTVAVIRRSIDSLKSSLQQPRLVAGA
uniref:BRCT domain-containing protein n=1 Tax=Setaria digitata TaxID=48799 RepID=A0A915PWW4_9BILA